MNFPVRKITTTHKLTIVIASIEFRDIVQGRGKP